MSTQEGGGGGLTSISCFKTNTLSAITSALLMAVADFGCRVSCYGKKILSKSCPTKENQKVWWCYLQVLRFAPR
jgi:hypothetical protein